MSDIRIRTMTDADLPAAERLTRQAGWNQTNADWQRFIALQPNGCFVAELDGRGVATVTTCTFGPTAWIAMLLVDATARGRGIGTAMMNHAIEWLEAREVDSIRLDATPFGEPIYRRLGFEPDFALDRFQGRPRHAQPVEGVEPARVEDLQAVADLDRQAAGADRTKLLSQLFDEHLPAIRVVRREGEPVGMLAAREGFHAIQIGPCVAAGEAGEILLADALVRYAGLPVFVDIPEYHSRAVHTASAADLVVQRSFVRMTRGSKHPQESSTLWASSGPEKG